MHDFSYHRPSNVAEAASLLAGAEDGKLLAGGQTLIPTLKLRLARPSDVIDLSGIAELSGIKVDGGTVTIGATTRHADVASSAEVREAIPALAALAEMIGDP
ncbi:MAG: FAD binding domain-containing protein, partial [Alphaproteobacteria bacterium]|nr:FAD binding domain-containing protein [Alphaproteobacteria bacterium]